MKHDPELERWRKVRADFERKFKSFDEMFDYIVKADKEHRRAKIARHGVSSRYASAAKNKKPGSQKPANISKVATKSQR